ncbi:MAG: class I SAM-dependent methyltransferase [Planctomycetia bacterium]
MRCWKTNAKNEFDAWSGSYDRSILQQWFFKPSHDRLLEVVDLPPGAKVLDLGCGTGLFARRLLNEFFDVEVVGLDISEKMLEKAALNCPNVADRLTLVHGDAEHLPFNGGEFDVVACIHSFHHYPQQQKVLAEMNRVLRRGGKAVVIDGDRDPLWGRFVFDGVVTTIEGMVRHRSAAEFRTMMAEAGMGVVEQHRGGNWAPFLVNCGTATAALGEGSAPFPLREAA